MERREGRHQASVHPESNLGNSLLPRPRETRSRPGTVRSGNREQLCGCDLVKIRIRDVVAGTEIRTRAIVQKKTARPVQLEITADVRASLLAWQERRGGSVDDHAFPSRVDHSRHMSMRQHARRVDEWMTAIGLRPEEYGLTRFGARRKRCCCLSARESGSPAAKDMDASRHTPR